MMTRREIAMHKARAAHNLAAWLGDLYELQAQMRPNSPLETGINQAISNTLRALGELQKTDWGALTCK